jgi:REP element-mobilizing transposase RayT
MVGIFVHYCCCEYFQLTWCTCLVLEAVMPAYARRDIVDEEHVGVYHCIARCVRRAFLCGTDSYSGRDYGHRKAWIVDRLRQLAGLFAVEVCDYAIMSNHLHLVLRNRPDVVQQWPDAEVALRWRKLFRRRNDITGEPDEPDDHDLAMLTADAARLTTLRARLASLSWFMRCLCEWVARAANREDGSGGRFWAGRFKSQPLLDEAALLACSVYVDLNPIRAGIAATPEESEFTSCCDRIRSLAGSSPGSQSAGEDSSLEASDRPDAWLCELTLQEAAIAPGGADAECSLPALQETAIAPGGADAECSLPALSEPIPRAEPIGTDCEAVEARSAPSASATPVSALPCEVTPRPNLRARASDQGFLPIETSKYIMLLDWTGRELRRDKRGTIPDNLAPILDRLGLDRGNWVNTVRDFGRMFKQAAGRASSLARAAPRCSRRWFQGKAAAQIAFL